MEDGVERFIRETPGVESARSISEREFLHVYHGTLSGIEGSVRFLTLAPDHVDGAVAEAFTETAQAWQSASTHPNVVTVHDHGSEPRPWVATDQITHGEVLAEAGVDLPPADIGAVVEDLAEALRVTGLYNTRPPALTPEHVWLVTTAEGPSALVGDWGLEEACRAAAGDSFASPYTPPERLDGDPRSERSSVYELGAVSYYLLASEPPVEPGAGLAERIRGGEVTPPPDDHGDQAGESVGETVSRALSVDPGARQESVNEFKRDLLGGLPEREDQATTGPVGASGASSSRGTAQREGGGVPAPDDDSWFPPNLPGRPVLVGAVVVALLLAGVLLAQGGLPGTGGDGSSFAMTMDDVDATVAEGERLAVAVTLENTDRTRETQRVTLDVDGLGRDSVRVTLDGGESTAETLAVETGGGDVGEYTAEVTTGSTRVRETVSVVAGDPTFAVEIVETSGPVVEGERFEVTANIENTGDVSGEQTVWLNVTGVGTDSKTVALASGESTEQTFAIETSDGDAGEHAVELTSGADTDSDPLTVEELPEPFFEVAILSANGPIEGAELAVNARIENTGDAGGTQTVTLNVLEVGSDAATVSLASDESTERTLAVETGSGDAGQYTATVASDHDEASASVTVEEPDDPVATLSSLDIASDGTDADITEGDGADVAVDVSNEGDLPGTFDVTMAVGDAVEETTATGELDAGETETVTFPDVTGGLDAGGYSVSISAGDDETVGTLTVERPPTPVLDELDVASQGSSATINGGQLADVAVDVTNVGDQPAAFSVDMAFDTTYIGTVDTDELDSGATETVVFEDVTGLLSSGEHDVVVSIGDDPILEGTVTVEGEDPDPPSDGAQLELIDADAPDTVAAGGVLAVDYTIKNTGDETGTESFVDLLIDGTLEDSDESITLAPDETATGTLTYDLDDSHESGDSIEWSVTMFESTGIESGTTSVS